MDPPKTGSASERRNISSLSCFFTAKLPVFVTRFIYPKPSCWRFSRVVITILDFFAYNIPQEGFYLILIEVVATGEFVSCEKNIGLRSYCDGS